ncbi:Heme d1 biosynthesis protein NirH [hydrothermal vent metagenome]|uniref:siroheme decarboxylase n=1 Tax=hydrothermal vent metagenome TaxID=652676 RepID=A0A3B0TJS5_9ZZZZ
MTGMDPADRALVAALQDGLPLDPNPWPIVAERTGLPLETVMERLGAMQESGVIRRIAALPNHYRLGLTANGMTVWDVEDDIADGLGQKIGALAFVSHCYRRPRALPDWRYNLFAMVHGGDRAEVQTKAAEIARLLGPAARANDILYSVRILKKTGLRIAA